MAELRQNTWTLDQWYAQDVAGNATYSGAKELWGWGDGNSGQLGLNQTIRRSSPVQIPGTTWGTLGGKGQAGQQAGAIKTDGTLWLWGSNGEGVLGQNQDGSAFDAISSPIQVGSETTWAQFAQGYQSQQVYATKTDGTLWSWGRNRYGMLGLNQGQSNNDNSRSSPTQVGGTTWSTDPNKLGGGYYFGAEIKSDGTLWTWGENEYGRLGQSNTTDYSSPTQIPGTWNTISSGFMFATAAINTDGELFMWGRNQNGEVGDNSTTYRSSPTQIPGTWANVKAAQSFVVAAKTDGTMWAWGQNQYGECGQNSTNNGYSSPVQVYSATDWSTGTVTSYIGNQSVVALKTDGTIWGWGRNQNGILGVNDEVKYSSPVQVPGTDVWHSISGTGASILAIKEI